MKDLNNLSFPGWKDNEIFWVVKTPCDKGIEKNKKTCGLGQHIMALLSS